MLKLTQPSKSAAAGQATKEAVKKKLPTLTEKKLAKVAGKRGQKGMMSFFGKPLPKKKKT